MEHPEITCMVVFQLSSHLNYF